MKNGGLTGVSEGIFLMKPVENYVRFLFGLFGLTEVGVRFLFGILFGFYYGLFMSKNSMILYIVLYNFRKEQGSRGYII